jgi:hypothetical protein
MIGVGFAWVPFPDEGSLSAFRERVRGLGGVAPVIRGAGGLGWGPGPGPAVQRRIKSALDPAGILAPGRMG